MAHRLCAREGRYLSPRVVVSRLEAEFPYVEVDEEDGRRHVRGIVQQLRRIADMGLVPITHGYVERLIKAEDGAIYVYFGDDPGSETACLSTAVIPGEPLYFVYSSRGHAEVMWPLLVRCAAALDYEIVDA